MCVFAILNFFLGHVAGVARKTCLKSCNNAPIALARHNKGTDKGGEAPAI